MIVQKAYKTEINPNNAQRTLLLKHAGAARWAYNWGITQKKLARENGEKAPSAIDLNRRIICMKAGELSWMREVSKCAPQEALRDLDRAFANFFKKRARFPKFKSKKNGVGSFRLYGMIHIDHKGVQDSLKRHIQHMRKRIEEARSLLAEHRKLKEMRGGAKRREKARE